MTLTRAIITLQTHWAERDRRYAVGPTLGLTDAQVLTIRASRLREVELTKAPARMAQEAKGWTPPPFLSRGRL